MFYRIAVPHLLRMGRERRVSEEYTYDNPIRRENNEAFSRGVQALFEYLSSPMWTERTSMLRLSIVLQTELIYTDDMDAEPGTIRGGIPNELPLAWYTAKLVKGTVLKPVSHVRAVEFPRIYAPRPAYTEQNCISLPAQIEILSACGDCEALTEAKLDGNYYTADDLALMTQKRNDTAKLLQILPRRIRTLRLEWCDETRTDPYEIERSTQPRYHVPLPVPYDALSRSLHCVSMHLRELHISELNVTPDFFLLSQDERDHAVLWPHLETLRLTFLPMATTNGQPLEYDYSLDEEGYEPVSLTPWHQPGSTRVPYISNIDSNSIVPGFFDDLYASAGHAVQRMPRLRSLLLSKEQGDSAQDMELCVSQKSGKRVLQLYSLYGYSPTQEVLDAWRIPREKMVLRHEVLEAEFAEWPPPPIDNA